MNGNNDVAKKRRNLSLVKTPTISKSSKCTTTAISTVKKEDVICLSSDDENAISPPGETHSLSQINISNDSNSSQTTILYSLTPLTPVKTPRKTPLKTPQSSSSDSFQTPSSNKFFSPTKKRNVVKRTPVKKNLAESFIQPQIYSDDALYTKACEDMDDKSKSFQNYLI